MKKFLITNTGNYYKANLHCHSTVSDGTKTPEQLKQMYMEKGYSIIAYTDHDVMIPHYDLKDDNFLPLIGFEIEMEEEKEGNYSVLRVCHMCLIALEEDNLTEPCWHRTKYRSGNAAKYESMVKFDESIPDFERVYSPECVNEIIRRGRENGFFVTYNHPTWSLETYEQYSKYHGMNAMEICNYGCVALGYGDHNSHVYDEMSRDGKRLFCIAADDNHNSTHQDSFGGFTMIKADKLEYRAITSALEKGDFYASEGPIIKDVWYEDGRIYITFEPAREAFITTGVRRCDLRKSEDGSLIEEASFDVMDGDVYVRLTVKDASGNCAYTNAFFVEDLKK